MRRSVIQFKERVITLNTGNNLTGFHTDYITVMLLGTLLLNGKPVTAEGIAIAVVSDGMHKVVSALSGVFCIFIYYNNTIVMGRSMHSGPQLFYRIDGTVVYISDKISDLAKSQGFSCTLNLSIAKNYLNGCSENGNETFINGINKINNGEFLEFDWQLSSTLLIDEFCIAKSTHSVIDDIIYNVGIAHERRDITLLFSGGVDSALIFHALKESGYNFSACHYVSDYSNDSEKHFARAYCLKYGVPFTEVKKDHDFNEERYDELNPDVPDEIPLALESQYDTELGFEINNNDMFLLCGHGGDHIFGQNPSILFGLDAFRDHGLRLMHKKMVEYASLKGKKYHDILIANMSALKQEPAQFSLAKDEHISTMRLAASQFFSLDMNNKVKTFTPFLHKNIVQHYTKLPVFELFNNNYDRYPIRLDAFRRFSSDIFWKKTKRSSSQLIFRILSEKQSVITNIIEQSGLCEALNINQNEMKDDLYENTTIRLTLRLPYLINFYRLSKFMQLHKVST